MAGVPLAWAAAKVPGPLVVELCPVHVGSRRPLVPAMGANYRVVLAPPGDSALARDPSVLA